MRLLLLMLGISICVVGIGTRAEAQNYPWCAYYSEPSGGTIAASQHFNNAWTPRAGLAATANLIRNMFPLPDRIGRRGFKGAILTERYDDAPRGSYTSNCP